MTQPPPQKKAITQFHIDKQAQVLSEIEAKGGVWGKSNSTLLQGGGSSKKYREAVDDSDNDGGDDGDVAVGFHATTTMGREYDDENNGVGMGTFLSIQPSFLKKPFQVL